MKIQVDQTARDEQAMRVLRQAAMAGLGEPESPLQDTKPVLNPGPDTRLGRVARFFRVVQRMISTPRRLVMACAAGAAARIASPWP